MELNLPPWVTGCMNALEEKGYAAYAVGGCVRDACLGRIPHDYDLCTSALPEQTRQVFRDRKLVLAGLRHGTVGVVTESGVVEITTFRREGTYGDNRHPDSVDFVDDIAEDLSRRDFTVNAMAFSPRRGFSDPFGGRQDLQNKILRAVGDPERRFEEDALRILRGVRFSVRFQLQPEQNTLEAMLKKRNLLDHLARERVFEELCGILMKADSRGLQQFAPILSAAIPELAPMIGFDQRTPYHAYDLYTHTALVVSQVPEDLTLRWAALLHDIGKVHTFTLDEKGRGHFYGHDRVSAEMADTILQRLRSPSLLRQQVTLLIRQHMTALPCDRKLLHRRLSRMGWELTEKLWYLQKADLCSKGADVREGLRNFEKIRDMLEQLRQEDACLKITDLKIGGRELMALGYEGREIGACLQKLFAGVLSEQFPNEREALLKEAARQSD